MGDFLPRWGVAHVVLFVKKPNTAGRCSLVIPRRSRVARRIPQQLIRDVSAEEPFRPVRTPTTDHDCPIASDSRFIKDSLCDIVFMAELQRDPIQRKSGFPEQLQRLYQNRVYSISLSACTQFS